MSRLKWGLVGGGEGSQIGPAHRLGAAVDGQFDFVAGALDHRPEAGRAYGQRLGLAADRSYGDWRDMLAGESAREDRVDLVTVATPNATHYAIAKAFLEAGFHVLCEKPMTMTVEEGEDLVGVAEASGRICAVNYGYSGRGCAGATTRRRRASRPSSPIAASTRCTWLPSSPASRSRGCRPISPRASPAGCWKTTRW